MTLKTFSVTLEDRSVIEVQAKDQSIFQGALILRNEKDHEKAIFQQGTWRSSIEQDEPTV